MSKAILIQADDWEGLFIDGKLVQEGHTLNEGLSRTKYFIGLAEKYNFELKDLQEMEVTEEDDLYLCQFGGFPSDITELSYDYRMEA